MLLYVFYSDASSQKVLSKTFHPDSFHKKGTSIFFLLDIKTDSPSFPGDVTTLNITLLNSWSLIKYQYKWWETGKNSSGELITYKKEVCIKMKNTAGITGFKNISVEVSYEELPNMWMVIARNETSIELTDVLTCHVHAYQDKKQQTKTFDLGKVSFYTNVHDPNDFLRNLTYAWKFRAETESENGSSMSHVFTKEGLYSIHMHVTGSDVNSVIHSGVCNTTVNIEARLHVKLFAWQKKKRSSPRLPSKVESFAPGIIRFQADVDDPFHYFASATYTFLFNFGNKRVNLNSNKTSHVFKQLGTFTVTVLVKAILPRKTYFSSGQVRLCIDRPIHGLNVFGENDIKTGQVTPFRVKCHGSYPVSFCWYVTQSNCDLPDDFMCSPTLINDDCEISFNHTFKQSGKYCVNVSAVNTVGFANVLHYVDVIGKPKKSHGITTLVTTLPILAICLLAISVFVAIKYSNGRLKKRKETEEAKFDFRISRLPTASTSSTMTFPWKRISLSFKKCNKLCFTRHCYEEVETESDEESPLFSPYQEEMTSSSRQPKTRKISYYGTVHMNLAQLQHPIVSDEGNDLAKIDAESS